MKTIFFIISNRCYLLSLLIVLCLGEQVLGQSMPGSGNFYIQNVATGQVMYSPNDASKGTKVVQVKAGYTNNELFSISPSSEDSDSLVITPWTNEFSESSSLYFGVQATDNAPLLLTDNINSALSKWKLEPTGEPLTFRIRSLKTSGLLTSDSKNNIFQQYTTVITNNSKWRIIPAVYAGFYSLRNRSTGKLMELPNFVVSNTSKVAQASNENGLSNQNFEIRSVDNLYSNIYSISPVHTRGTKYLDSKTPNVNGQQLQISGGCPEENCDYIKWRLIDASTDYQTQYVVLQSLNHDKIIGVSSSSDSKIIINDKGLATDPRYQWELVYADEVLYLKAGRYKITNSATSNVWSVPNASLDLNTLIKEEVDIDKPNQYFDVSINDNGKYIIAPVHARNTRFISVDSKDKVSNTNGTALRLANTQGLACEFDLEPLPVIELSDEESGSSQLFGIRSAYSGLNVGVQNAAGKAEVIQWNNNSQENTRFQWIFEEVEKVEDLKPGRYIIQNVATGKVLDVTGMGTKPGTSIIQFAARGGDNQKFEVSPNGNGYTIRPLHTSAMYLNVCQCTNTNNSPLTIWGQNWPVEQFSIDLLSYDDNDSPIYTITSLYSNLNIGVHNAESLQVIQWNVNWGIENDSRFQWRFIPTTSAKARELIEQNQSIVEATSIPQVDIFPNPTSEAFAVKITEFDANENLTIVIADGQGNQILNKNIGKERELSFDAATLGLKQQTYVIQIHNGFDKRVSKILKFEEK